MRTQLASLHLSPTPHSRDEHIENAKPKPGKEPRLPGWGWTREEFEAAKDQQANGPRPGMQQEQWGDRSETTSLGWLVYVLRVESHGPAHDRCNSKHRQEEASKQRKHLGHER
jgi:hypothetical protein